MAASERTPAVMASATAFSALKIVGGLYLIYLGIQTFRVASREEMAMPDEGRAGWMRAFRQGGVDLQKTIDAISQGAAGSWMFTNRAPQIIRRDWRPGFMISLQQKDLRLVLDAADELGVPLPGTSLIFNFYRTLEAQGLSSEGNHGLMKALEHLAGFEVGAEK